MVEAKRLGNLAARPGDNEHAWQLEPVALQPALRLRLRRRPGGLRPAREKDDLPPSIAGAPGDRGHCPRFDFLQCFPEIFGRPHRLPKPPMLRVGQDARLARVIDALGTAGEAGGATGAG